MEQDIKVSKHFVVTSMQHQETKSAGQIQLASSDTKKQRQMNEEAAVEEVGDAGAGGQVAGPVDQYDSSIEANKNREKQIDEV